MRLLAIASLAASIAALYGYLRNFKRTGLFFGHGTAFCLLELVSVVLFVDLILGHEALATTNSLKACLIGLQFAAAFSLSAPVLLDRLAQHRDRAQPATRWCPEVIVLYVFSAVYPVQHYVLSNLDHFTLPLAIQFSLVAALAPAAAFGGLFFYVRPYLSDRAHYITSLAAAVAIFGFYMRPLYRQFSIILSESVGTSLGESAVQIPLFLLLFGLGCKLRSAVAPFLSLVLIFAAANLGYAVHVYDSSSQKGRYSGAPDELTLKKRPSIYILIADAYQDRKSLISKGLERLDIGRDLSARGFTVYENAYSNYKPTMPSLTSFFDVEHHYYQFQSERGWENLMTGDNKLYSILQANDYRTVIAHPNDYLVRGHCNSDVCYPAPGFFGQVGFTLAETIYYRDDFANRTAVGMGRYSRDFYQILEESSSPVVVYSHVAMPAHGPRGCSDPEVALTGYESGLRQANEWLDQTIAKVESLDDDAIILVLGDHGAFLSNGCTWSNPIVTSSDSISDNLGILMAVRWPDDYDDRYDDKIHSLIDLSWYLLQYLSGDAMDESAKPRSTCFLVRDEEKLIYEVVQDGKIVTNAVGSHLEKSDSPN